MENKHVTAIPAEVLVEVHGYIHSALNALQPYVLPLTPEERRVLPKMGDKTLSFVEKSFDFATSNPALTPPYVDMAAFAIDKSDATGLRALLNSAHQLVEYIDDTEMVAGSEAYQSALSFYNAVKLLASQDIPGAKAVYEELKKFFHKVRVKSQD
ncbi:MAG: hypothetical protein LBT50_07490 [Prevotellaceae bacterium]|jgi:hypothetical protein|nr:hypothetical protein [Prevotellaceae bacterium]